MTDRRLVTIAKALADPTRCQILRRLRREGSLTCSCLCDLPLTQPTISHHLQILHKAGLIRVTPKGQYHMLRVNEAALRSFARSVALPPRRAAKARPA